MAKSILTRGQKRLLLAILVPAAFLLGNAAYLWLSPPKESILPTFYQWMLVLHVVIGIVILVPMVVFVVWHMRRALAMRNPKAIVTGIALTAGMFALALTGLLLFEKANSAENRWAFLGHQVLALAVPAVYGLHRWLSRHRPERGPILTGIGAPALFLLAMLAVHHATLPEPPPPPQPFVARPPEGVDPYKHEFPEYGPGGADPDSIFFPASTETQTGGPLGKRLLVDLDLLDPEQHRREIEEYGFTVSAALGARTCNRCHQDIVEQWARSAHRFSSFNNPFYRVSVEDFRDEEDGRRRSQWCAGCHDPAVMMPGDWMGDVDPLVPESQAGLTCLACHAMDEVHGVGGNGNYRIADARPDPYLFPDAKEGLLAEVNELLVKSKPGVHKREMLKPVFRTREYCATCHKVSLDAPVNGYRWLRGQDEYDNHHDSGVTRNAARTFYLPPTALRCQDCHMPLVEAPLGDVAAKNGMVRSHVFNGPNTALPFIRGDMETLAEQAAYLTGTLRVDVFAVKRADGTLSEAPDARPVPLVPGESVELQVVVRNKGVGHTFPGGTLDSNEAWIHFAVFDADDPGHVLYESGAVDPDTLRVDPDAHFYRALFVDEHGEARVKRDAWAFRAPVHVKTIGPGTADLVRYRIRVPESFAGRSIAARAVLRWRKFTRAYTEYTWNTLFPDRDVPELPITDVASAESLFPVAADGTAAELDPATAAENWVRWNDWGIAFLLQGDTVGAQRAFTVVRDALPERVDGYRNLARVALADGDVEGAVDLMRRSEEVAPGDPQNAYFFGVALGVGKGGDLEGAIDALEIARETFPDDRTIHRLLGRNRYQLGEYEEALRDFLRVLAIDPEDRVAHYHRFLIYTALGDEKAAALAEKVYRKYQIDESAQEWTETYRRANPDVNRESQMIHVHDLELRE